ncbi:MAG TPA: Calx-beta domain-containing protein, partial [Pyrinomonadaceae bacterium]|nr:Calx-beta domain-containing protein [Pyrinomonadaceae bacterium]
GSVRARINVGQGPTGLALDEPRSRLYVLNRFDETVSVVDTSARTELTRVPLGFNPEPAAVRDGRRFLYNGAFSAHGDLACASCHPGGHRDGLAWDLGDPLGDTQQVVASVPPFLFTVNFHPMKGPMVTQSLRGIINANPQLSTTPLHWRGDRAGLENFNPAFVSLLGGGRQLDAGEMASFVTFVRTLTYPSNPNENLDRTQPNPPTGPSAERGRLLFGSQGFVMNALQCTACHPGIGLTGEASNTGTTRAIIPSNILVESQSFKVPHLRALYQKTGLQNTTGEQITGYGFTHDGHFDSLFSFLHAPQFTFPAGATGDSQRRDVEAFMLSFDTGTAPTVGLEVTVNATNKNNDAVLERVNLLIAQAKVNIFTSASNCDLVVKGIFNGQPRGFFYNNSSNVFLPDRASAPTMTAQQLLDAAGAGAELTFKGVAVGAGHRLGIDRNEDGTLDGDAGASAINLGGVVTAVNGNPVGGVTVTINGPLGPASAQTDASGRYSFTNLPGGAYNVTPALAGFTFAPASQSFSNVGGDLVVNFIAPSTVQFSAPNFNFSEGAGDAAITVTRTGDTSQPASVVYATVDNPAAVRCDDTQTMPGVAFARCDYATTIDTLTFAPGETTKTFNIPLIDDAFVEGAETIALKLSEPAGATLGAQTTATLTIIDNDTAASAPNPILASDNAGLSFFVRQQYLDFLSREPDTAGFNAWLGVLNNCSDLNNNPSCDRLLVSQSFFGSPEFQLKGFFVYKFYKVSFNRLPAYDEIITDMRSVTGQTSAEVFAKRAALTDAWVERPEFVALYPNTLTDAQFVQTLLARYNLTTINTNDPTS